MENPSPGSTTSPAVHPDILRMQLESKLHGGAHWLFGSRVLTGELRGPVSAGSGASSSGSA